MRIAPHIAPSIAPRTRRGFTASALLALLAVSGALPPAVGAADNTGEEAKMAVKQTTDEVLAVLADKNLPSNEKRHRIQQIVEHHFNFDTLARLTLAQHWKELSAEQQKEFVEQFKEHLSLTYGRNVETYHNEKVVITGTREEARSDWTVKTKIARPEGQDILVDYRLRKEDGQWRVIDVIIEGVSLVANYRSQFQDVVSKQGPAKLIAMLRDKNAKGEPLKGAPGT